MVYIYDSVFIHSPDSGRLGCFHVLAFVNSAAVDTWVHVSFQIMFYLQLHAKEWDWWAT